MTDRMFHFTFTYAHIATAHAHFTFTYAHVETAYAHFIISPYLVQDCVLDVCFNSA